MGLADGIRKHGFRAWHERELLAGHGWLVLTLLCGVVAFAALESLLKSNGWAEHAMNALIILVVGGIGLAALRRFLFMLVRAQKASSQATCPGCTVFGRLAVVAEDRTETWVRVRCRACAHEWSIDEG
jgi:hypothetical protein